MEKDKKDNKAFSKSRSIIIDFLAAIVVGFFGLKNFKNFLLENNQGKELWEIIMFYEKVISYTAFCTFFLFGLVLAIVVQKLVDW